MSIRIDESTKTITMSVGDLCAMGKSGGSLNLSPLGETRIDIGRSTHKGYQARQRVQNPGYLREQPVRFVTQIRDYTAVIEGRVDGIYKEEETWVIEEVKSVLSLDNDLEFEDIPAVYLFQLRLYLYFWMETQHTDRVIGSLVLVNYPHSREIRFEVLPEPKKTQRFIEIQLGKIISDWESHRDAQTRKRAWADRISFPFPQMRKYQDEMIQAIEGALTERRPLLISAPTGIGKTAAALYAVLRFALKNDHSIFFLTSKTTQQRIVADTLRLWSDNSPTSDTNSPGDRPLFTSLILRSKEKSCANDVVFCHEARCRFAKQFYTKLENSNLLEELGTFPIVRPDLVYSRAVENEVCPFELSLEILPRMDLVVCDYNYVYDPRVALRRILEDDYSRTILIIDEAHNLYARGREYYSPQLDFENIQSLKHRAAQLLKLDGDSTRLNPSETDSSLYKRIQGSFPTANSSEVAGNDPPIPSKVSRTFLKQLIAFLEQLEGYFSQIAVSYPESYESRSILISLDKDFFASVREELEDLMRKYLVHRRSTATLENEDMILHFFYGVANFCKVLELEGEEFVHVYERDNCVAKLKILCLDPSNQLRKRNQGFYSVIAMSATLSPLEFYRDVLGFDRSARSVALPSPFPAENRKILVIPEVSTTYKQRSKHFLKIAQIIEEVISVRTGNYFVFFPSFDFLKEVSPLLRPVGYQVLTQERVMPDHTRNALFDRLSDPTAVHLVLAVQGGVFAEGVDYPGELAVGAIIVGPGLPKVSFESELMRQYFEEHFSKGFEYAYLYPGMNRVVQSAGRIIRTETDRGVILLLDKRFTYENYADLFPRDWYDSSPSELISKAYLRELSKFWGLQQPRERGK